MVTIYESVLSNLKHKKASPETLQLWEVIWSYVQKNGVSQLDDLLNNLINDFSDSSEEKEGKND